MHISPLLFEMIGFSVDMLGHIKNNSDRGHVWLRTILMQLCVSSRTDRTGVKPEDIAAEGETGETEVVRKPVRLATISVPGFVQVAEHIMTGISMRLKILLLKL
ncbi:hypothetical protein H6F61_21840 [Cyanobacteria bacterium FACHB-472]|nr:hypothetical protein [Cyanobacteria bacterium FACHB-472]